MARVVHFEIVSEDAEKTKELYKGIFGWGVQKWEGPIDYWFLITGEEKDVGINGAYGLRETPEDTVVNTIDVDDLEKYIKLVEENGGTIIRPKSAIPGVGWLAYFRDTEGNVWGMMQDDPTAK